MAELYGYQYLRNRLIQKQVRVRLRYKYYEMKNETVYISGMIPKEYRWLRECLGWCGKAVDALADRIVFNGFKDDNFDLNTIYRLNNSDILFDSAVLSALISSCCFIYISTDETGFPRLQVLDGSRATGIIDPITGLLTEGYAVVEEDEDHRPTLEAYFTAGNVTYYPRGGYPYSVPNIAPYPLLVPVINRPDAKRPFGHSRISRACMRIVQSALRTVLRSEIAAEFYSIPQKYVLGLTPEAEYNKIAATMSTFIRFDKDSDGDRPTVGQFQQQSMTPHSDQLKMFAALFAGETGLTLDDLGFATENPSSAEAIKASHENMRLTARKAQRTFGSGFLNAGYLAACLRDNFPYRRKQLYLTTPKWCPIFEPDSSMLSLIGDGVAKINAAMPDYVTADTMEDLTGIKGGE